MKPTYCQVCSQSLDHTGRERPNTMNDIGCYNMTADYETVCPIGQNLCFSKLEVDWYIEGDQLLTFKRGCMADNNLLPSNETTCQSSSSNYVYIKDCTLPCSGDNCNVDREVELGYAAKDENGQYRNISCYEYSSRFDFNGDSDAQDIDLLDEENIGSGSQIKII